MKHLKQFENNTNYKIGDHVLLNTSVEFSENFDLFPFAKIIKIDKSYNIPLYQVETIDLDSDEKTTSMNKKSGIIRKLNQDEIKEYELRMNANKYNI